MHTSVAAGETIYFVEKDRRDGTWTTQGPMKVIRVVSNGYLVGDAMEEIIPNMYSREYKIVVLFKNVFDSLGEALDECMQRNFNNQTF